MNASITEEFSRNMNLENILKNLNSSLWIAENDLLEKNNTQQHFPHLLIMGAHRSGTTLFLQWLANTGIFAYPTNLLSRFYRAPILGAKIQLILTDPSFNYRDELIEYIQPINYISDNGKTKGILAPNEFWYFWRSFLPDQNRDVWTDQELMENMDYIRLVKELNGITEIMEKPFAAKAMLFNYNIPFLDKILDKVIFIHMKRDEAANAASALNARKRQFGSENAWYSFIIPEYETLQNLDPINQVVGQIRAINRAVEKGFNKIADFRKMTVQYEEFCDSPEKIFLQLTNKLAQQGMEKIFKYHGPDNFKPTRTRDIDPRIIKCCAA